MKKSIKKEEWKWIFIHYAQILCYAAKEDETKLQEAKKVVMKNSCLSQALLPLLKHFKLVEEKGSQE